MAVDIGFIENSITEFYNFKDKSVIHVGVGGGQLIGYSEVTKKVLAIDIDEKAVKRLEKTLTEKRLLEKFKIEVKDILEVEEKADVIFFEFCLHEMPDPLSVLNHAKKLADEIVIVDHHPNSDWAWTVLEETKASNSLKAINKNLISEKTDFKVIQEFSCYDDLFNKVIPAGEEVEKRIDRYKNIKNISIEMKYFLIKI